MMNEYSIHVSNGKVIGDSTFYLLANESLSKECKRLCDFTDTLDKDPAQKKESIAEYKCAKYRYAAVSTIHTLLQMNNFHRKQNNIEYSHYVLASFDKIFMERAGYFSLYEAADANEKPDYSLYYALLAMTEKELAKLETNLKNSSDWERIELEERIGGWCFAKKCLDEAWQRRKEVTE